MAKMQSPVKMQTLVIIGAIVAGAAIAISLFALYPDMMLENTSLDPDGSASQSAGTYGGDLGPAPSASPQSPTP